MTSISRIVALAGMVILMLVAPTFSDEMAPGHWTRRSSMPQAMDEVGGAAIDGKIYIVGGQTKDDGHSALIEEYDPALNRWRERAPMPMGLSHPGVTALGGKLYVFGGFTAPRHGQAQDAAFVYDPKADHWSALPNLSSSRGAISAVALDEVIHVVGGRGLDGKTVATHEVYDPHTARWSSAAPLPRARDHTGIAALGGMIHVFGGRTEDGGAYSIADHDVYDPRSDRWSKAAPLPVARSSGAFTVLDGKILFAGGECRPKGGPRAGQTFDDVTAYDPDVDRWITLTALPGGRHAFAAGTVSHTAYFAAGAPACGDAYSADVLAFTFQ